MESFPIRKYAGLALLNLGIVAFYGMLMRYKIGFEFPWFDQKNLQHAHSHFAFTGWITHTLFFLIVRFGIPEAGKAIIRKFNWLIMVNLICAYGMLVSFSYQGYGAISIFFSTLSMLTSWLFAFLFFRQSQSLPGNKWIKAGLLFNLLSSCGTAVLASMMASKNYHEQLYLGSVYFYLHFQYNGWFFFACVGILLNFLNEKSAISPQTETFRLFFLSCAPAFLLSVLWLHLPLWLLLICALAAIVQLVAWIKLLIAFHKLHFPATKIFRTFLLLVAIAGSIKFVLQAGSTIPEVSRLAFGFRTIVIAYLHLVLLAFISLFMITFLGINQFISMRKKGLTGLILLTIGIAFNELVLLIQGIASFSYVPVKSAPMLLFVAAIMMFTGIMIMVSDHWQLSKNR
jgi:hypothetical protein